MIENLIHTLVESYFDGVIYAVFQNHSTDSRFSFELLQGDRQIFRRALTFQDFLKKNRIYKKSGLHNTVAGKLTCFRINNKKGGGTVVGVPSYEIIIDAHEANPSNEDIGWRTYRPLVAEGRRDRRRKAPSPEKGSERVVL